MRKGRKNRNLFILLLIITILFPNITVEAEAAAAKRAIHVVYDDSGSMIQMGGEKYDTWCQAKYSMEVFASMLSQNDKMNIYVMSDYMYGASPKPKLTLNGSDGAEVNVERVHNMITKAQDTPFHSVEKAYSDLVSKKADEKWLVVLTDGEFDEYLKHEDGGKKAIDKYFSNKKDDIKVMFFGMGKKAAAITEKPEENIFFEKATNNNEILNKITGICTRIFNSHRLGVNIQDKKVEFDVPMSQLIVFAQGAEVNVGNLIDASGKMIAPTNTVSVRYSEKAATNPSYQEPKIATNLVGKVATFNGDFDAGSYTIESNGAQTIEVYYKPNVAIEAYLKNADGEEVTNIENLETGEYTIEFGFIRVGTNEIVPESQLLGDVKYSAVVTNNGMVHDKTYSSGDKIKLEEGNLSIDATASFLDYNTVSTSLNYSIYKHKEITFISEQNLEYVVTSKGIGEDPTVIELKLDDKSFTKEQWKLLEIPAVELGDKLPEENQGFLKIFNFFRKFNSISDIRVEKGEEPGVLYLYPLLENNKVKGGTYVGREYSLSAYAMDGKAVWKGETSGEIKLTDNRSIFERETATLIGLTFTGGFIFILLGYTSLFKKRIPKSMQETPTIECKPVPFGKKETTLGSFSKDTMSVILPFVPETGTLSFVPFDVIGIPSMRLKAAGGSRMIILNTASYAGNNQILIDGDRIPDEQEKQLVKTPNMTLEVKTPIMNYSCTPRF